MFTINHQPSIPILTFVGVRETAGERSRRLKNERNQRYRQKKAKESADKALSRSGGLNASTPTTVPTEPTNINPSVMPPPLVRTSTPAVPSALRSLDFSLVSAIHDVDEGFQSPSSALQVLDESALESPQSNVWNDTLMTPTETREGFVEVPGVEVTPRKPHCARKAASLVYKHLPRSNSLKCLVVGCLLKRLMRENETKLIMANVVSPLLPTAQVTLPDVCVFFGYDLHVLRQVHSLVRNVVRYRERKDWDNFSASVQQLKTLAPLSKAAVICFMSKAGMTWLCTKPEAKKAHPVTQKDVEKIVTFISKDTVTQQLPSKKYAGKKYMRKILLLAYAQYALEQEKDGDRTLSFSSFYRNLPGEVRVMGKTPFRMCACETCVNFDLTLCAVHAAVPGGGLGLPTSVRKVLLMSVCEVEMSEETIVYAKRECVHRDCQRCKGRLSQHVIEFLSSRLNHPEFNSLMRKTVTWHRWGKRLVDGNLEFQKWPHHGSVSELVSLLCDSVAKHTVHMFNFLWQGDQFEALKASLKDNETVWVMDFAMNIGLKDALEPQSTHWSRKQVTLHPIVAFYNCQNCPKKHQVVEELMFMTDDRTHDPFAVTKFENEALEYFRKTGVVFKTVYQYTDNAPQQYKSKTAFYLLSKKEIAFERNFFGSRHGKSAGDAFVGRVKQAVYLAVRGNLIPQLTGAADLLKFCESNLTKDQFKDGCMTYSRRFFHVKDIQREQFNVIEVEGSSRIHCVRNTGVLGVLDMRVSSCSCSGCRTGEECEGVIEVDSLQRHAVVPGLSREDLSFDSALWDDSQVNKGAVPKIRGRPEKAGTKKKPKSHPRPEPPLPPQTPPTRSVSPVSRTAPIPSPRRRAPVTPDEDSVLDGRSEAFPGWKRVANDIANCQTFGALQAYCRTLKPPSPPSHVLMTFHDLDIVDRVATADIPMDIAEDTTETLVAAQSRADGNCFPRSLSRIVYGHGALHVEMRCRLTMELCRNFSSYMNEEILQKGATLPDDGEVLPFYTERSSYFAGSAAKNEHHLKACQHKVLAEEIMYARKTGKDCGK